MHMYMHTQWQGTNGNMALVQESLTSFLTVTDFSPYE